MDPPDTLRRHYLSPNGMEELHSTRRALASTLSDMGAATSAAPPPPPPSAAAAATSSESHTNLVRALLCAGWRDALEAPPAAPAAVPTCPGRVNLPCHGRVTAVSRPLLMVARASVSRAASTRT